MPRQEVLPLPPPIEDQAYYEASALQGGFLTLPDRFIVSPAETGAQRVVPCLSFVLTHSRSSSHLVFDLGIDRNVKESSLCKDRHFENWKPEVPIDVATSLDRGGLKLDEISHIILSHVHWDHVGDPSLFRKAEFIVGGDARQLFQPGYPTDPGSAFPSDLLPPDRTNFIDVNNDNWKPIGPFPRAFDFFRDGSLYLIDSPGHLRGHMNVLARTSSDGGWIYLAGDSAHNWRLLRDQAEIADFYDESRGNVCVHADKDLAAVHIRRIADLMTLPRVKVILAHDDEWYAENKDGESFWPGSIKSA